MPFVTFIIQQVLHLKVVLTDLLALADVVNEAGESSTVSSDLLTDVTLLRRTHSRSKPFK